MLAKMSFPDDETLAEKMALMNPWWAAGYVPAGMLKKFRRRDHATLARHMDGPDALALLGARRVGKATMLRQLAADLVESGTDTQRLLFLSLEALGIDPNAENLRRALEAYARNVLGESVYGLRKRVYAILDEAHLIKGWQAVVGHFYDRACPVKFVVSASSAAGTLHGTSGPPAGRMRHQTLFAASFAEFLAFKSPGIADAVGRAGSAMRSGLIASAGERDALPFCESAGRAALCLAMHRDTITAGLAEYMRRGGYPMPAACDSPAKWSEEIGMYIDLSLHKDAARSSRVRNSALLGLMFRDFAQRSPCVINAAGTSREIGLGRDAVVAYCDALERAFLVSFAEFYAPRSPTRRRRGKKVYVNDVGIRNAVVSPLASGVLVTDHAEAGRMAETVAADHTRRLWHTLEPASAPAMPYYWHSRGRGGAEVDLVMTLRQRPIPVGIRYRQRVDESDLEGLSRFSAKFDPPLSIAVSRNDLRLAMDGTAAVVPLWLYLLMC